MSFFDHNKFQYSDKNIYVVVEEDPDFPNKQNIICACWSKTTASNMCLDPTRKRSLKSVPIVDTQTITPKFDPVGPVGPVDPFNPSKEPIIFPPKVPFDFGPVAKPRNDFKIPFAPKKPDTRFDM